MPIQKNLTVDLTIGNVEQHMPRGTLIEATDQRGRPRLSIGFETRFQTFRLSGLGILSVQFQDGNEAIRVTPLGKGGDYYNATMNVLRSKLIVRQPYDLSLAYIFDPLHEAWEKVPDEAIKHLYCGDDSALCSIISQCSEAFDISDHHYLASDCALLGGTLVWSRADRSFKDVFASQLFARFIDDRYLVLLTKHEDRYGFVVCVLSEGRARPRDCRYHAFGEMPEDTYAIFRRGDELLLTTNYGRIYVLREPDKATTLRVDDGTSFQLYSVTQFGGDTVIGMYPYADLLNWKDETIEPYSSLKLDPLQRGQWEAQSLAIYKGKLFVGTWPWGIVWAVNRLTRDWEMIARLFSHPEYREEGDGPYVSDGPYMFPEPVSNLFNQRVTDLIPLGDSLYALTGAKAPQVADVLDAVDLSESQKREYGALYRMRSTGSLSVPVNLNAGDRLRIKLDEHMLTVLLNDQPIGRARVAFRENFCISEIHKGDGLMGPAWRIGLDHVWVEGALLCEYAEAKRKARRARADADGLVSRMKALREIRSPQIH